jgi:hypothetical protein
MNLRQSVASIALLVFTACAALRAAAPLEPLRANCSIGPSEDAGKLSLHVGDRDCAGSRHCDSHFNDESFNRFTGITLADLGREGAHLTATLAAEAGTFTCSGAVHSNWLEGESVFTPDEAFVSRMAQMGFTGLDSEKLMAYAFIGVESEWARSMQQTGIRGLTADNLLALRIFKADPAYIQSITSLGYEMPNADQLIGLKVQGVDPAEVREIRSLGYQPTLDELVQIRIFKITPDFIRRMQARGLKNLTIAKLVQIRIFKLAD